MYMNEQLFSRPVKTLNVKRTYSARISFSHRMLKRLAALLAVVVIIGLFSLCVSVIAGEQDAYASTEGYQSVEVVSGDTLWTIAASHTAAGQDIREYISKMRTLNHLKSSVIYEGQVLLLP